MCAEEQSKIELLPSLASALPPSAAPLALSLSSSTSASASEIEEASVESQSDSDTELISEEEQIAKVAFMGYFANQAKVCELLLELDFLDLQVKVTPSISAAASIAPTSIVPTVSQQWLPLPLVLIVIDYLKNQRAKTFILSLSPPNKTKFEASYRGDILEHWIPPEWKHMLEPGDVIAIESERHYRHHGRYFWFGPKLILSTCSRVNDYGTVYPWMTAQVVHTAHYWAHILGYYSNMVFFDYSDYEEIACGTAAAPCRPALTERIERYPHFGHRQPGGEAIQNDDHDNDTDAEEDAQKSAQMCNYNYVLLRHSRVHSDQWLIVSLHTNAEFHLDKLLQNIQQGDEFRTCFDFLDVGAGFLLTDLVPSSRVLFCDPGTWPHCLFIR